MDFVNLLFSYQGRINRAKYWLAVLVYMIGMIIIVAVFFAVPLIGYVFGAIVYLAMIVSGVMVGIKRLHDRDKSGWWVLLFYGVPTILSWGSLGVGGILHTVLSIVSFAITVWAVVELGCLRGTVGPNQYGPDPLTPA